MSEPTTMSPRSRRKMFLKKNSGSQNRLRLSTNTLKRYQGAFDVLDFDKDGKINSNDIFELLTSLGKDPTSEEIHSVIRSVVGDKESINFEDFAIIMNEQMSAVEQEEELSLVFDTFDMDNDGFINMDELRFLLTTLLGEDVTERELRETMEIGDRDSKGKLNLDDFKYLVGTVLN
eukprot:TRINITY_DN2775_c0_g1_i1.p2 TRINITY_DN2775_c0_g1~~TRINITY_DN2775_c0_g1_i1.p2  ORF type:complete len:176 (-),score=38.88 TRINITY_DN2775_c0_g1_i1:1059-1586(-)